MITVHTASERPDLWERASDLPSVWPEYNRHGDVLNRWWGLLDKEFPEFQFVLHDERADSVAAAGFTAPLAWDGRDETLPDGIDAVVELIFRQRHLHQRVNTLCALAAEIPPGGRSRAWRPRSWPQCARSRSGTSCAT